MGSLFDIAKSGINSYRQALAVTGQNIANVNTEGYSKRDVGLEEVGGIQGGVTDVSDQSGLGVRVEEIRRSFNAYINERLRASNSSYEQVNQYSKEINSLQNNLLPEGSDLSSFIGNFFSSLQELAATPEDSAPRTIAMEAGKDMANSFKDYSKRLDESQEGAFSQTKLAVEKINLLSGEIANVNTRLKSSGATKTANDLLDTRDLLLEKLSKEIEFTTSYGDRGDVTIKLGNSGQGPTIVSPNKSFNLRAKVTENSDFRYAFETTVNSISLFIVEGVKETSTTQITGGKLAGLINYYAYVQETKSSIDDIAFRVAKDFNEIQKNGKDLTGKIGKDMFLIGLPNIEKNLVSDSSLDIKIDQLDAVVSLKNEVKLNFNGTSWIDNNKKAYKGNSFNLNGLAITLQGNAKVGDSFSIKPNNDLSGSLEFNLKSGNEFAASAFKLAESNTNNLGTAELNIEGSYQENDIGVTKVEDVFVNTNNSLLATTFLKDGAVASIGKNIKEIDLRSFSLQPLNTFVISDEQAKTINSFDLTLANGNNVSITFSSSDTGTTVKTVRDLAEILNSGVTPGGSSFSFASYGLIASGADGKLTIASNDQNFSSSSISTRISGTLNGVIKNPTSSELQSSNINIFTREGKHIAGTPLKLEEYSLLINEKNGFLKEAVYNAEYINQDYRNIEIARQTVNSDYVLFTGHSASRSSNSVTAQTISVDTFNDGVVDKTLAIPVSSSSSFTLKEFKEKAAITGISAEAITRVLIEPIDITVSGTVSMSLASGLKDDVSVSATVLPDDLTNIVTEINKVSDVTGVKAILTSDKKRFLLENSEAQDIKISNFVLPTGTTTAYVLDQNYAKTSSNITLGSSSSNNSAVFTGTIKLGSAVDFALTSTDGSSNLTGDAALSGFDNGRASWTWSDTGEILTLNSISYGSADNSIASNDGSYAAKAFSSYSFDLPSVNSSSTFSSTVYTDNLVPNTDLAIHKAHLEDFRSDSPDIRVVGSVINTLPTDGTKLSLNFEGQTYNLETQGKNITVEGGEKDRISAFFTPVSGWSGSNATEITSSSTLVVSSGNTFQLSVDGTASGTITLPAATYSSNTAVASAIQTAINEDTTLSNASKSVNVKWNGTNYELVSNTGAQTYSITDSTVASVKITSIDSTIESDLKLSHSNGATESINGYQLGIVGAGSISASQITFPSNSENTTSKTALGLDSAIKNIEGKAVSNNPTNREYFDINIKTGSYISGDVVTLSSSSSLTISGTNTLQLSVDGVSSGTITMPTGTYTSNISIAKELEEAINDDSTLSNAGKSISVLWTGNEYQIVSKNGTSDAAIGITSVSTSLESHLQLTATNGGVETDTSKYRVKYTDAAWLGATATIVNGSSNLVIANSGNTFQLSVDSIASGTITLPAATYTSNGDIAAALQTAINADSNITGASKSVEVKWTGTAYKIISNGTSSQDITITSVDSTIEANLKLTTTNGGAADDYSFDLYDASGNGSDRQTYLNNINFEWNATDKNISITRKLDNASIHEMSFIADATNNEKFGIKIHPHSISLVNDKIVITSGTGEAVNVTFTGSNKSIIGEAISLKNLPPEELLVVLQGGGTARRVSASFDTQELLEKEIGQNLTFTLDNTNDKVIHVKDSSTGHNIAQRTLTETGRFKVGGYNLKLSGTAKTSDSFTISDNIGGVGDGRNILAMLDLQEDKLASEGKGNFQELFSEIVASVGSSVQSAELNKTSAEMIRDAAANSASELSGVNMDEEAAQLIEYQQAYQASARVLQTARELFDTLIDRI